MQKSHCPAAQAGQGTGSGRRTTPTTRSPGRTGASGGASSTRPSDSCPITSRGPPAGSPWPSMTSASVPQMPATRPSARTEPSAGGGSGDSAISAEPWRPGITLIAFMVTELIRPWPAAGAAVMALDDYPVSTGPVGSVDQVRLQRVVNVMQQFIGFPPFNIDSMLMGGG